MQPFLTLVDPPEKGVTSLVSDDENDTPVGDNDETPIGDESNEPNFLVSVDEIKTHLRISNTTEDDYLQALINAVTNMLDGRDGFLGRALLTQTWRLTLPGFPPACRFRHFYAGSRFHYDAIILPLPPLQSVASIKYIDNDGVQQTLDEATYRVITDAEPGWIEPVYGGNWPSARWQSDAVEIEFVCGYGDAAEMVPDLIRQYLKIAVGDFYRDRESTVVGVVPTPLPHIAGMLENFRIRGAMRYDGGETRSRD